MRWTQEQLEEYLGREQGTGSREQEKLARVRECLINCVYAEGRSCPDDCPMKDDEWKANGKAACRALVEFNVEVPLSLLEAAIDLLKAQEPQWMPITFRELTEEEKTEHPDWCYIIDSPTPDDGEDILVSDGKTVWADAWSNNGEWCALESDHELEGVAWMKMPTPWREEGEEGAAHPEDPVD